MCYSDPTGTCFQVTKALRNEAADNRPQLEEMLSLASEDILMVHVADGEVVGQHCPDFAVLRIREHQQIVLVR